MGPEGFKSKPAIEQDPDSNAYNLSQEAAAQIAEAIVLSEDDVQKILIELGKPDLHPALKKAFELALRNRGVEIEQIEMRDNQTLH